MRRDRDVRGNSSWLADSPQIAIVVLLGKVVEQVGVLGLHVVHREHTQKGLGSIDGAMVAITRRGTPRLTLSVPIRNGSFGPSTDGIFAAMMEKKIGATTTPTASTTTSAVRAMTGSPTQTHP